MALVSELDTALSINEIYSHYRFKQLVILFWFRIVYSHIFQIKLTHQIQTCITTENAFKNLETSITNMNKPYKEKLKEDTRMDVKLIIGVHFI